MEGGSYIQASLIFRSLLRTGPRYSYRYHTVFSPPRGQLEILQHKKREDSSPGNWPATCGPGHHAVLSDVFCGVRGYVSLKFGVRFLWVCRYVGRLRRVRRYVHLRFCVNTYRLGGCVNKKTHAHPLHPAALASSSSSKGYVRTSIPGLVSILIGYVGT